MKRGIVAYYPSVISGNSAGEPALTGTILQFCLPEARTNFTVQLVRVGINEPMTNTSVFKDLVIIATEPVFIPVNQTIDIGCITQVILGLPGNLIGLCCCLFRLAGVDRTGQK